MIPLPILPLTREAYAPFGDLIDGPPPGNPGRLVNQGFVRRHDFASPLSNLRPHAELNFAFFRCKPRPPEGFVVDQLERHPDSTQLFLPLGPARYLVVVALGGERPDLSSLAAFVAASPQGVSYHPGIWHLPLVAFDQVTDFACLVYEDSSARDCEVALFPEEERRIIAGPFSR
ncbi:MAG: ureidoglycolate lyase [Polyangiaceae bacterium]|jgi:ureidoglycolate lyase|nr:ureidoglycolate lyase [Polyangiaceae bacterium]